MIPPANMIQDESGGKEDERDKDETPKSPTANASQQETKVGLSCYYYLLFTISPDILWDPHCASVQLLLIEQRKQTSINMVINRLNRDQLTKKNSMHVN